MVKRNSFRFSHEETIYNELLKNKSLKKASEEALSVVSLKHSHETLFSLATDGFEITNNNSPKLFEEFTSSKKLLEINPKTKTNHSGLDRTGSKDSPPRTKESRLDQIHRGGAQPLGISTCEKPLRASTNRIQHSNTHRCLHRRGLGQARPSVFTTG